MAEVKGVLINSWLRLLREKYSSDAVDKAIGSLNEDDRRTLTEQFLSSSWYPYDTLARLSELTKRLAPARDPELAEEIGKAIAQDACSGVYKSFVASDPLKQMDRIPWIGDLLFKDLRRWETVQSGPSSGTIRYHYDMGVLPNSGLCRSVAGFLMGMIELAGGKSVAVKHPVCVVKGGPYCEYELTWQ